MSAPARPVVLRVPIFTCIPAPTDADWLRALLAHTLPGGVGPR
ncbi:MAG TPA: hypothetical protein VI357_10735 [Mycobacteriales bacterium]